MTKIGDKYGKLTIIERNKGVFTCFCDCGEKRLVKLTKLLDKNEPVTSCGKTGCRKSRKNTALKHGKRYTPTYNIWSGMKDRCNNLNNANYIYYGGRNIQVCKRWLDSFSNFLEDMGERPTNQHSLDRIDNNGSYTPENCRWATAKEQANNTRNNRYISFDGETKTLSQWADSQNIQKQTISSRIKNGWSLEKALTTPAKKVTKNN